MSEMKSNLWKLPTRRLQLAESSLHVWRADLSAAFDAAAELLSADEKERAQRFAFASDRERWLRARGILRALLGSYLDLDPSSLRFSAGTHGKPALVVETGRTGSSSADLHFNLSHSGGLALYAFSSSEVGVDVEVELDRNRSDRPRRASAGPHRRRAAATTAGSEAQPGVPARLGSPRSLAQVPRRRPRREHRLARALARRP